MGEQPRRGRRILCLDGGGAKGLNQIRILQELERLVKEEGDGTGKLSDKFDLIIGTSVGAIVAGCMGLNHMTMEDLFPKAKVLLKKVFHQSTLKWIGKKTGLNTVLSSANYDASQLEVLLRSKEYFGEKKMNDQDFDQGPKVAFVATTMDSMDPSLYLFRNYSLPKEDEMRSLELAPPSADEDNSKPQDYRRYFYRFNDAETDVEIWKALRASSAAPTYFDPIEITARKPIKTRDDFLHPQKTTIPFVDGGLVANNPVEIGYQECRLLWPDDPVDLILCIGAGLADPKINKGDILSLGGAIVNLVTSAELTAKRAAVSLFALQYGGKYYRFNAPNAGIMPLDATDDESINKALAETDKYLNNEDKKIQEKLKDVARILNQEKNV